MTEPTGKLRDLIDHLDRLGPAPSLVDLTRTLKAADLTAADVAAYVKPNPHGYNRGGVAVRDAYELLVMTWTPGQAIPPHDHGGSICAMQTVVGRAVERNYFVAADGYVDPEYDTAVEAGEVIAGHDAAVHAILNEAGSGQTLVTVHVYAPPLKELRRFVPRPPRSAEPADAVAAAVPTVVVVGGGFSGAMTAAQVLRQAAGAPVRVVLAERRGAVGEGVAYSARDACLRLNVPAGRMSAWPDDPDDFVRWATRHYGPVRPDEFLPRQWFGEYVRDTLLRTARGCGPEAELSIVLDEVRRVARMPDGGWMVTLGRGGPVRADAVVLAVGHRPPSDPLRSVWTGPRARFIGDPWRPMALHAVGPDDPVVVLGTGLTAVDVVTSLFARPRTGPVTMVSRRGLKPQAHADRPTPPVDMAGLRDVRTTRELVRRVRAAAATAADWRSVIDGLRPHTAAIWQQLPVAERRRFLSHVRQFWEVHRHRTPAAVGDAFDQLTRAGRVVVRPGRITRAAAGDAAVDLTVCCRGDGTPADLAAAWVINCTGPTPSNTADSNPAVGSLLIHDHLCPDDLHLGLRTGSDGVALRSDGSAIGDLFVVGTLRKPDLWESTAVPELRAQAAATAGRVVRLLAAAEPSIRPSRPVTLQPSATMFGGCQALRSPS